MICMITYDLNSPGQNYESVIKAIKDCSTGVWCTYWKSAYLIQTKRTVQQISDAIKPFLDKDDRLIIIETKRNYQGWLERDQWEYIQNMFETDSPV